MLDLLMTQYAHVTAFIMALIMSLILGPVFIPLLKRLKFGQTVRDDGPQTHLVKTGVPTIGGLIFIIPMIIVTVFFAKSYPNIIPLTVVTIAFGLVGLADDLKKIFGRRHTGLNASQKMVLLILVATAFAFYASKVMNIGNDIIIPFRGIELTFDMSFAFIPFIILVLAATTNGVNLTDGLDGLAGGVTFIIMLFFTLASGADSGWKYVSIFTAMIAGGCLGFLAFNLHPAKVFMGDAGSLALGGAVGAAAIVMKMPLILIIAGGVYVIEILSDIIQVVYFKKTGNRVFKMAPLHHHFELCGWKETKVALLFWGLTLLLCVAAFLALGLEVKFIA